MTLDLDAIKKRCEVATKEPWELRHSGNTISIRGPEGFTQVEVGVLFHGDQSKEDAQFIVHARSDTPALIKEVELERAENAVLVEIIEGLTLTPGVTTYIGLDAYGDAYCRYCNCRQPHELKYHKEGCVYGRAWTFLTEKECRHEAQAALGE